MERKRNEPVASNQPDPSNGEAAIVAQIRTNDQITLQIREFSL